MGGDGVEIDWDFATDAEGSASVESGWAIVADGGVEPTETTCTAARLLDAEYRNRCEQ